MNFDGGRVKIEVRETLFCVFAGTFHRPVGPIFFKGDDFSFFPIRILLMEYSFEFTFNTPRPAWNDFYRENAKEGKKKKTPRRNTLNIIFFAQFSVFSAVAQWSERLLGLQVVRVQGSTKPHFIWLFLFVCFCFFLLLVCFPLIPLLALRLSFTRFCDTRFSELLGMIGLLLGIARYDKLFLGSHDQVMTEYD